ncbi:MAG: hypothetical protein KJ587_04535 [Alphaproteobacteria bacterium]|nr:hypothetical protein [Alphaproteobacteria bacterium]
MALNLAELSSLELLQLHGRTIGSLRDRGVLRSKNNPIADLAELLFCRAFNWTRAPKSASDHDAIDAKNLRYEIKARQLDEPTASRQVSAIRNLDVRPFDYLAGVLFDQEFAVLRAAIIPIAVVKERSTFAQHTNSHIFHLRDDLWKQCEVSDATSEIKRALRSLSE